jgi:hypothetical protein
MPNNKVKLSILNNIKTEIKPSPCVDENPNDLQEKMSEKELSDLLEMGIEEDLGLNNNISVEEMVLGALPVAASMVKSQGIFDRNKITLVVDIAYDIVIEIKRVKANKIGGL